MTFDEWLVHAREAETLERMIDFLVMDQRSIMPTNPVVVTIRGKDIAALTRVWRRCLLNPDFVSATERALGSGDLNHTRRACLTSVHRRMLREGAVSDAQAEERAELESRAGDAWANARESNGFDVFADPLKRVVELQREIGSRLTTNGVAYDGLLQKFEPGAASAELVQVLEDLATQVKPLLEYVLERPAPSTRILDILNTDPQATERFAQAIAMDMGFDPERGSWGRTTHAFMAGLNMGDTRIFTFREFRGFRMEFLARVHEAWHAMYEQGFDPEWWHTALARPISYGIHESQSRLGEVGLASSLAFWFHAWPFLLHHFPALRTAKSETGESFETLTIFRAMNKVGKTLIRIESDPLTYDLHILLRTRIEAALIADDLRVQDIPEAWNEGMRELLGLVPDTLKTGCLQDPHWSLGYFGYFPTYSIGNLTAAQLLDAYGLPGVYDEIAAGGGFTGIRTWLRENVHARGESCTGPELVLDVTGRPLSHESFMAMMTERFREQVYPPNA